MKELWRSGASGLKSLKPNKDEFCIVQNGNMLYLLGVNSAVDQYQSLSQYLAAEISASPNSLSNEKTKLKLQSCSTVISSPFSKLLDGLWAPSPLPCPNRFGTENEKTENKNRTEN